MIKQGFIGLFILFCILASAVLTIAWLQPSYYRIQRSIQINAEQSKIYELVSKSEHWKNWMPWELKEEEFRFIETLPLQRVRIEFLSKHSPKKVQSDFLFVAVDKSVIVSWGMDGYNTSLKEKFFYKFKNFKVTLENDFELGLNQLKALAESPNR